MVRACLLILTTILSILPTFAGSDPDKRPVLLKGKISDALTGIILSGANVFLPGSENGTCSNDQGEFELYLDSPKIRMVISYIGYSKIDTIIETRQNSVVEISLLPERNTLDEIEITASEDGPHDVDAFYMSREQCEKIPAFLGEKDIIKAMHSSPSVNSILEGHSGYTVRGGNPDQNLVTLDGATVYNPSHLLGFFSSFSSDAIKDASLYSGDHPVSYGGRLSSVMEVNLDDGHRPKIAANSELGLISAKLTVKGPMVKDKLSFMVSGRRSYADFLFPMLASPELRTSRLYFYDLYGKVRYQPSQKNELFITYFQGTDTYKNHYAFSNFSNSLISLNWMSRAADGMKNTFTMFYSEYGYQLGLIDQTLPHAFLWKSYIREISLKDQCEFTTNKGDRIVAGIQVSHYTFNPCIIHGQGEKSFVQELDLRRNKGIEVSFFTGYRVTLGGNILIDAGLRISSFSNLGPALYIVNDEVTRREDTLSYAGGGIIYTRAGLEPRLKISLKISPKLGLQIAYSRNIQHLHRAQHSVTGTPLDVWFSSNPLIGPQTGDQYSAGIQYMSSNQMLGIDIEGYYKKNHHALDFADHANLLFNDALEKDIQRGKGTAYGLEFTIRKEAGKLNGMISYAYSKSTLIIEGVNGGCAYASPYDVPNDLNILVNYRVSQRMQFSANWVYASGKPFTMPAGKAIVNGYPIPVFAGRNSQRLPDHHRLDLSLTYSGDKTRKFWGEWILSVYNVYNRKNIYSVSFVPAGKDQSTLQMEKNYLFPIIPAITYRLTY